MTWTLTMVRRKVVVVAVVQAATGIGHFRRCSHVSMDRLRFITMLHVVSVKLVKLLLFILYCDLRQT